MVTRRSGKMGWLLGLCLCLLLMVTSVGAQELGAEPPDQADTPAVGAPGDAPDVSGRVIHLPAIPANYRSYDSGWIHFAYPPEIRQRIQPLIARADAFRAELRERFGKDLLQEVHVRVARSNDEMETLAPRGAPYPRYAAGVAYSSLGLVLLSIEPKTPNSSQSLQEIFLHELAHVALHDALGGQRVPRWFNEGLAIHLSGEATFARMQTLWSASLSGHLLPLEELRQGFPADILATPLAYAQSADVVRFLLRQKGSERFRTLVSRLSKGQDFSAAIDDTYGFDSFTLEHEWRQDVARRYSFWPVFFGGSTLWVAAIGLSILGWRRKRRQHRATLDRWAREERLEDQRIRSQLHGERIHIVLQPEQSESPPVGQRLPFDLKRSPKDGEVPKVEHDGSLHTLH